MFLPISIYANSVNDDFILNKLKKLDKIIEKGEFVDAQLYINKDTVNTQLLKFTKGDSKLNHFICIEIIGEKKYKLHYAEDINGFKILDDLFVKIYWEEESIFIKRIAYGNIDLYEKKSIPSDTRYLYFLHEKETYNLHIINPESEDISAMGVTDSNNGQNNNQTMVIFEVAGLHDAFVAIVNKTMGDCLQVKSMVKTGNYLRDDLIDLVNTYNKCFD